VLVKVYFRDFTFKKPENEKGFLKRKAREFDRRELTEGNSLIEYLFSQML